jgi:hypothetical protein
MWDMSECSDFGQGTLLRSSWSCSGVAIGHDGPHDVQVERPLDSKGPTERLAACRQIQAPGRGVQVRPTSWQRSVQIGGHDHCRGPLDCDDSHQIGLVRALPATDARPDDLTQSTRFA